MHSLSLLADPNAWAALVTLTALEIVLGIDNLVFISVLTTRLAKDKARRARLVGLSLAFIFRVIMLAALTWLIGLTTPLFGVFGIEPATANAFFHLFDGGGEQLPHLERDDLGQLFFFLF